MPQLLYPNLLLGARQTKEVLFNRIHSPKKAVVVVNGIALPVSVNVALNS